MIGIYFVVILPSGVVERYTINDPSMFARDLFNGATGVVTLLRDQEDQRIMVGWIHDFGLHDGMVLNRKAWSIYGRSPIYGPMVVAFDGDEDGDRDPLPDAFVTNLDAELAPGINAAMDQWLAENPEFPR